MTPLLQQAFSAAAALPVEEQDTVAVRLLAELADEDEFDRVLSASGARLSGLATAALAEYRAGETIEKSVKRQTCWVNRWVW